MDWLKNITDFLQQSVDKILLLLSGIFLLISFLDMSVKDGKWSGGVNACPHCWPFLIGVVFLVLFGICYWRSNRAVKIDAIGKGVVAKIGKEHTIRIVTGSIQDINAEPHAVIVLPSNTTFDDMCINDGRSSLGAFFKKRFPTGIDAAKIQIIDEVGKTCGYAVTHERPAPIGTIAHLRNPLGSSYVLFITAVTCFTQGVITSDAVAITTALKNIFKTAACERYSKIFMPVIGTGHGGVNFNAALFLILAAFIQECADGNAHLVKELTVVIHDPKANKMTFVKKLGCVLGKLARE